MVHLVVSDHRYLWTFTTRQAQMRCQPEGLELFMKGRAKLGRGGRKKKKRNGPLATPLTGRNAEAKTLLHHADLL